MVLTSRIERQLSQRVAWSLLAALLLATAFTMLASKPARAQSAFELAQLANAVTEASRTASPESLARAHELLRAALDVLQAPTLSEACISLGQRSYASVRTAQHAYEEAVQQCRSAPDMAVVNAVLPIFQETRQPAQAFEEAVALGAGSLRGRGQIFATALSIQRDVVAGRAAVDRAVRAVEGVDNTLNACVVAGVAAYSGTLQRPAAFDRAVDQCRRDRR